MDRTTFVTIFAVGSGVIAMWIHVRFPKLAPDGLMRAMLHILGAMVFARLAMAAGRSLGGYESFALARVFALYLPVLTYCLLAAIWMMSLTQGAMRRYR